jgi:hypothetical protein
MISAAKAPELTAERRRVLQQVAKLRHELEDLTDYLDILEARAKNLGKPRLSTEALKQRLGIKSARK